MAMARPARALAKKLTGLVSGRISHIACPPPLHHRCCYPKLCSTPLLPFVIRSFSSTPAQSWRSAIRPCTPPGGLALVVPAQQEAAWSASSIFVRFYAKRPKKWQGARHAFVQAEPGALCPPYSPNAGSVKKRKHNKRMAQRAEFIKAQAHQRKQETKAALIKRDAARRKRWREGAARAQSWAKHLQTQQSVGI